MYLIREGRPGARAAISLAATVLLAGCSIWNPHVEAEIEPPRFASDKPEPVDYRGGLAGVIDYANSLRAAYYEAVGDQSKLRNGLALTLVPMSAAALGFGITGGNPNMITALGLSGATLYGVGTFFDSKPRQRIYLAGTDAIGCMILAMSPLLVDKALLAVFNSGNENGLAMGIPKVETEVNRVQSLLDSASLLPKSNRQFAASQVTLAKNVVAAAAAAQTAGNTLITEIDQAGPKLMKHVSDIKTEVSRQILNTEPDLATILQIVGNLDRGRAQFLGEPKKPEEKKPDGTDPQAQLNSTDPNFGQQKAEIDALNVAVDKLDTARDKLNTSVARANGLVNQVAEAKKLAGNLSDCRLAAVETDVAIDPPATDVELKVGESYKVLVTGGKTPYRSRTIGVITPGIEHVISRPIDADNEYIVTVTKAPENGGGEFSRRFTGAAGGPGKTITFTVGKATGGNGGGEAQTKFERFAKAAGGVKTDPIAGLIFGVASAKASDDKVVVTLGEDPTGKFDQQSTDTAEQIELKIEKSVIKKTEKKITDEKQPETGVEDGDIKLENICNILEKLRSDNRNCQ